ncbi:MAG: ATP phosphoribosyltransferase [Chloroflexi bacterium]|nr:ATP phosphoribosyltransferase [Chloroflexota bacterium]
MERASDTGFRARQEVLRLAIPSDGELHEPALRFLQSCGMPVERASARRYTAELGTVSGVVVLFQRVADISLKVEEGSADLGIVGLDRFAEFRHEDSDAITVLEDLRFGRCELVLAVPDAWIDVVSTADLADLSVEFREQGRELRVATKYPRLVERFLHARGINYFTLVPASGTLEVAPAMGYADFIADITSSGTTLRENRLKTVTDGTILASQACLVGNRRLLGEESVKLQRTKTILERIEGHLRAEDHYRVSANIHGESAEAVAAHVMQRREVAGVQGPTISPVLSGEVGWYAVTIVIHKERVLEAVEHLRLMGGNAISVTRPDYLFQRECEAYQGLLQHLRGHPHA